MKKNKFTGDLLIRGDGRVEWVCGHGVGHTIAVPKGSDKTFWIHCCDGCEEGITDQDIKRMIEKHRKVCKNIGELELYSGEII